MTRVLLNTQVFIAAAAEGWSPLPHAVRQVLSNSDTQRILSAVSLTEIAIKSWAKAAVSESYSV